MNVFVVGTMQSQEAQSLEEGWASLKAGVDKLLQIISGGFRDNFTRREHAQLYAEVYQLCTRKSAAGSPAMVKNFSSELYDRYEGLYDESCRKDVPAIQEKHAEELLIEFVHRWANHKLLVKWLWYLFFYLDRYHVAKHNAVPLKAIGVSKFQSMVFNNVKAEVRNALVRMIAQDREGEVVPRTTLKNSVQVFVELGDWRPLFPTREGEDLGDIGQTSLSVYMEEFEKYLLLETSESYARSAQQWIETESCPGYLDKVSQCVEDEKERVGAYLHPSTQDKLLQALEEECLAKFQVQLLDMQGSGLESMLREGKVADLARMFSLFKGVTNSSQRTGLKPIANRFRSHIQSVGVDLVKQWSEERDLSGYVPELLNMYDKYNTLVADAFEGDSLFQKVMKEGFEHFTNKVVGPASNPELMSNYCDGILRTGGDKVDGDLDTTLDKIVGLFSNLTNKDLFAESYRKQLAKRLLAGKSSSDDNERSLIAKIKLKCGGGYTSKLEGMMNDMMTSREDSENFKQYLETSSARLPVKSFGVIVLTTGFWPNYQEDEIQLPPELTQCMEVFSTWYHDKTRHRKLRWVHQQSTATVQISMPKKTYTLVTSTYQACVLLLFNDEQTHTVEDLYQKCRIPKPIIQECIESLRGKRGPILTKVGESTYAINDAFQHKMTRIVNTLVTTRTAEEERDATRSTVGEDRKHSVEACIVRVMKSRKRLHHQNLIVEVSQQCLSHFNPDPKLIKKRIEELIAREYLERDEADPSVYKYLA